MRVYGRRQCRRLAQGSGRALLRRQLLARLGFDARLQRYPDIQRFYEEAGRPSSQVQAGIQGWESDFPRPSDFFLNLLTCSAYQPAGPINLNPAGFCDQSVDRGAERAHELEASDPAAAGASGSKSMASRGPGAVGSLRQRGGDRPRFGAGGELPAERPTRCAARPALGQVAKECPRALAQKSCSTRPSRPSSSGAGPAATGAGGDRERGPGREEASDGK